jgi:peptidyl-prolyl cis-trans isomerase A (cyclophilin A)
MIAKHLHSIFACLACVVSFACSSAAKAGVVVEFNTNVGNFQVELFSLQKPASVANFLTYVDSGTYSNSIVHRSVQNTPLTPFGIIQGGGFDTTLAPLPTLPDIADEVGLFSNLRGTIAYAKTSLPNSANRQWYINVTDNVVFDTNYTVFGQVLGNGMQVVDQINAFATGDVTVTDSGGSPLYTLEDLPVINPNLPNNLVLQPSNLVVVNSITAVPEPGATVLLATTLPIVAWHFRRRRPRPLDRSLCSFA